jgi:hypothetical protein
MLQTASVPRPETLPFQGSQENTTAQATSSVHPSSVFVQQTTHGAAQFTVYEELKHMAARSGQLPSDPDRPISSVETTLFAAASKLAASITTYPSQVVR